ncbi:selenocysteine-specific translation elongation factor [Alcaligenaceae bacterium]|nr:selenocysteine-specific translation elongation factor [Alcaligenaceae bacterium]
MIVATAGHIDHGKTLLVRALTGIETDRLPEEKARGISIDLGFASTSLGTNVIGFVDVPGHERFIRNMLAGVCSIDAALLVIAADDGVMPQTVEHVQILDLLDVRRGVAVITKSDRVSEDRVRAVYKEVSALLSDTKLAGFPTLAVSALSGQGIEDLRAWLRDLSLDPQAAVAEGQHFRLAVDRVFTVHGSGTVVTGTIFNGAVTLGDHLMLSPRDLPVRVRGLQIYGAQAAKAVSGQRCAINIVGAGVEQVTRGDWLLSPELHAPTQRFDARLHILPIETSALTHWTPIHLHLGTTEEMGRVVVPAGGNIAPGASSFVQIVLEKPIAALHGDRFVIRDQSARRTLGGGVVLDPFPRKRGRRSALRLSELEVLERSTASEILSGLLDLADGGVDLQRFACAMNLTPERAADVQRAAQTIVLGKEPEIGISHTFSDLVGNRILSVLEQFHQDHPQGKGMTSVVLNRATAPKLRQQAFQHILRRLANRQALILSDNCVRLINHDTTANPIDNQLWQEVRRVLELAGAFAPDIKQLAAQLQMKETVLRDFLHRKSRSFELIRVTENRFFLRTTLADLAATAHDVASLSDSGLFTAAQFRDAIGTGRGLAIHILELFDQLGITHRIGNQRRRGKGPAETLCAVKATKPADSTGLNNDQI